jgi:enterochelin esterase-like enzyme
MKTTLLAIVFQLTAISLIADDLKNDSQMRIDTIYSEYLQENRIISVYLPPDFENDKIYPVIFATDGQLLDNIYKKSLDSMIIKGKLPKLIMIGVFSNEKKVDGKFYEYRNCEYIKDFCKDSILSKRFNDHMNFFTQEMIKYVEQKYPISKERKDRYFFGTSNGAGFGITLSVLMPDLFGCYICFSMAGGKFDSLNKDVKNYPFIEIMYGKDEPIPLTLDIIEFDQYLTKNGFSHNLTVYEGGHDRNIWRRLFIETIEKLIIKAPNKG